MQKYPHAGKEIVEKPIVRKERGFAQLVGHAVQADLSRALPRASPPAYCAPDGHALWWLVPNISPRRQAVSYDST